MLRLIDIAEESPIPGEIPTRTRVGDIWRIGRHRLLVGDSQNDIGRWRLLGESKVNCVFTDPPYKLDNSVGSTSFFHSKNNRVMEEVEEISDFNTTEFLTALPSLFKVNYHNSLIFTSKALLPDYLSWAKEHKLSFDVLVWKKNSWMPIGGGPHRDCEYMVFFRKNIQWNNEDTYPGANRSMVQEYKRVTNNPHPTPKPTDLIENWLRLVTKESDVVYDPYTGSGSTWCACIATKRVFAGAEIQPKFADLALHRAEQWSGEKAVKDA